MCCLKAAVCASNHCTSAVIVRNKTTGVIIKDTEMENRLNKAKFTSEEGCTRAEPQKTQGASK
jgi:hypothetical protein